jgi:hypothetical protein
MNRRELAKYLWMHEKANETVDAEGFDPAWTWYGTLRLDSRTTYRRAKRLLRRWSEEISKENSEIVWYAVVESARPDEAYIHILVGRSAGNLRDRCLSKWRALGAKPVSVFDYRPGAFCPFVIENGQDDSTFGILFELYFGLFDLDE